MSAAREAFVAAVKEFRKLADVETDRLARDAVRARDRGFPKLASDLTEWEIRLRRLSLLADAVTKAPGAAG